MTDERDDTDDRPHRETVDWTAIDQQRGRPSRGVALVAAGGLWLLGATADGISRLGRGDPVAFPVVGSVSTVDWLWGLTLLFLVGAGVWVRRSQPRVSTRVWQHVREDRAALLSMGYLLGALVVGVVGSRVLESPDPNPRIDNQPPVWTSVESVAVTDCAGEVTDGACHGTWHHPLGTTPAGEDLLAGIVHGLEVSMQVGLIGSLLSVTIATTVALTAVARGGFVEELLMRLVDLQLTFPIFFLYLLLAYTIGGSLLALILIFGCFGWGRMARIIRAEALQRNAAPYVDAARAAGGSSRWIMRRHLLPNVSSSVLTAATLAIPALILAEAAVAFLGLGDPATPSLGQLIADGRGWIHHAWWVSTIPGIVLVLTVLAFNFLGDTLRDALDPRHGGPS